VQTEARRRRVRTTGIIFPVAVFAIWRLAQLGLQLAFGAAAVDSAFQWDGQAYRRILVSGYHVGVGEAPSVTAFFPGLPWLTRAVEFVTPSRTFAEILTVNVIALAAFVAVYGATRAWRDAAIARRAVVLMALFPSSLFLWAYYTEGLFIALSAGALWADRRDKKWLTALLLAGVAATRPVGIGVAAVVVLAHLIRERRVHPTSVLYAVAGACGLGAVMVQQWRQMGDPLAFVDAQKYWHRKLDFPWSSIREGLGSLKSGNPRPVKVLDLVVVAVVVLCVVYAARRGPSRWPYEAWFLPIVVVGVPLCGPYLSSMNRFLLSAWPVFAIGSEVLGRSPKIVRIAWYVASALLAVALARYWAHGDFVA
jgi:hypothetical protein